MREGSRAPLGSLVVIALLAACSVPTYDISESKPAVVNSCKVDADCNFEICAAGMCVASVSPDVQSFLVEVVPPATAYFGAGSSFLIPVENPTASFDLNVPAYANVAGKVIYSPDDFPAAGCTSRAVDMSVPVHVVATRTDQDYGLPAFEAEANATQEAGGWRYQLTLPPGMYNLYMTVLGECDMPPLYLLEQDFSAGADYSWPSEVKTMVDFAGTILFAPSADPAGWTAELIEPVGGKRISTVGPVKTAGFHLLYVPTVSNSAAPVPLLKIAPPKDAVAPTLYWDLSVIDFDNDYKVALDVSQLQWSKATVRARVESARSLSPVAGSSVTIRSTSLTGAPEGLTAVYETTVSSGPDGAIEAALIPGTYQVIVVPPDDTMAVRQETWTVAASPDIQAGRTIQLEPAIVATGVAKERLQGTGLPRVAVDLIPWGPSPTVLEVALGKAPLLARTSAGKTSDDGSFALGADPGSFLLAVQTSEATGFPWIVRSGIEVEAGGAQSLALGEMKASFPVIMAGTVRDGWGPVQNALVRAWLPLAANGSSARKGDAAQGVIQIAQTRSDAAGRYRLLLPSELRR